MTLSDKAYDAMRRDIIRGVLPPGQPLRMADLSHRYNMGFSPLREALNRLQAERLVQGVALRGFSVAPLSLSELEDVINLRALIECHALESAIRLGDDKWASDIVAALYALNLQAERQADEDGTWELERRHHAFHKALLAACGSPWMLEFFETLYMATERYRLPTLMRGSGGCGSDIRAEHGALADATLARDAAQATALLERHYRRTAEDIARKLDTGRSDKAALRL